MLLKEDKAYCSACNMDYTSCYAMRFAKPLPPMPESDIGKSTSPWHSFTFNVHPVKHGSKYDPRLPLVKQIIAKPFYVRDVEDVIRTWRS